MCSRGMQLRQLSKQIQHGTIRSCRSTTFHWLTAGSSWDLKRSVSLSSCFSEQFAFHFTNFTLQLPLSSHCLNYLLLHKEWHFLWLRNSLYPTTLAAMCLTKGKVVADSPVLAGPLNRHQASARGDYWQIGPIARALTAVCLRLPVAHGTASFQLTKTNGATKPTHTSFVPFNKSSVEFLCPSQWCMPAKLCDDGWSH